MSARREKKSAGEGAESTPCAPELVQELLRQLDKTVRLHQLYPATNPTYLRTLEQLRAAFRGVWEATDEVTLQVTETQFSWLGHVVLDEPEKASDSLPWTLFKDGVRQLTLSAGFEAEELLALIDIIPKVRRAQDYEDDVLTLLWEQEFEHLRYRFLDTVTSEGTPLDPSAMPGRWPASAVVREDPRAAVEAARRRAASGAGIEAALRVVTTPDDAAGASRAEAVGHLQAAVAEEYDADLRRDVADALLDIFELQRDAAVRDEVLRHLDALTLNMLSVRAFSALAHLMRESAAAARRAPGITPAARDGLMHLGDRVSDPAMLAPLLEALEADEERPSPDDVGEFLDRLGSRALGAMFHWGAESRHHELRLLYTATADRLTESDPDELMKLVVDERTPVALEVMRRCGVLQLEGAVPGLVRQLGHAAEPRRAAALTALTAIGTPRAMSGIERALSDASVTLRTSAMKTLAAGAHRAVLPRIDEWVKSRDVRDMDGNERRALFELYGAICGDDGVPWLKGQLVGPVGFFKRKSDPETRACSAAALGRLGSPAALEVLRSASDIDDPLIRRAVRSALTRKRDA